MINFKPTHYVQNCILAILFLFVAPAQTSAKTANTTKTPLESFAKFQQVLSVIDEAYVDNITLDTMINYAIKGLMSELDAHSAYLDTRSYSKMTSDMKGEFGGLGIVISMKDGALTIISPIDDTPASKAGLKAGDIILQIEGESTLSMTINDAVDIMRGKPGTKITITIVRKGESKPLNFTITRGIIKVKSVTAKTINKDILYLRISSFDAVVSKQLKKHIKAHKNTKGIILDLRNNPGGLLDQAIKTVDLFVDKGVIVSQRGRDKSKESFYRAKKSTTITKAPLVVLVNGGSASASEIVSGALQDLKRGVVVGQNTFGKGSVQVIIPITKDRKEAIKITTAKYYLPSGRSIQAKGIVPDIQAIGGESLHPKKDEFSIKEKNLKKHLQGELSKIDKKTKQNKQNKKPKKQNKNIITQEQVYNDNQLKVGLDSLKVLILMRNDKNE